MFFLKHGVGEKRPHEAKQRHHTMERKLKFFSYSRLAADII